MTTSSDFSKYIICLASGENRLLQELQNIHKQIPTHQAFKIQVTGLHTGDIMIGRQELPPPNAEQTEEQQEQQEKIEQQKQQKQLNNQNFITETPEHFQPLVLVERKTIQDFASSFRSQHYLNQKSRMITFREQTGCLCGLVVEDYHDTKQIQDKVNTIPIATLDQCFTSIQIRDRFFVQHVDSVKEHAQFLFQNLKTIEKYQLYKAKYEHQEGTITQDYEESIKVKKKDNLTPELCYRIQISSIPGISLQMAEHISQKYSTMTKLIQALQVPLGWQELAEIKVGTNKFGIVKAQRLHEYLLSDTPITLPEKKSKTKKTKE